MVAILFETLISIDMNYLIKFLDFQKLYDTAQ
jgi:hypothetical protein